AVSLDYGAVRPSSLHAALPTSKIPNRMKHGAMNTYGATFTSYRPSRSDALRCARGLPRFVVNASSLLEMTALLRWRPVLPGHRAIGRAHVELQSRGKLVRRLLL